jgi:hypothetical protein
MEHGPGHRLKREKEQREHEGEGVLQRSQRDECLLSILSLQTMRSPPHGAQRTKCRWWNACANISVLDRHSLLLLALHRHLIFAE